MTGSGTSRIGRGIVPTLAFAVLTAALDVYAGNRLQVLGPFSLAAVSFTLTAAFFFGLQAARHGVAATLAPWRTDRYDVAAINVTTAVTWLAMLFALSYLEPALVNVIGLALGPVLTVLMGPLLRRGSRVLAAEVVVSVGITALLCLLAWGSFTGRSAVGSLDSDEALIGAAAALVCGIGSTANIIYMKRLSDAGHTPQAVLAVRFVLIIAVAWVMTAVTERHEVAAAFLPGVVVAIAGVGLPIYLLQLGIKHTEPITTSLLLALSPLFAFLLQLPDGRLRPSALTLLGIFGIVALVAAGTVARSREANRERATVMRCAIVDAHGAGRHLPAALRRHAIECLHVRSEFPDTRLEYRPGDFTVDIQHDGSVERTAALLRDHDVGFVVAGAESGVLLADALAASLGTPGNGMSRPGSRRDKGQMQMAVRHAGLTTADSFVSPSGDHVVAWARRRDEWPVVLKPVASAGTDNVIFCHSADEVAAAHARIMGDIDRYGRRNQTVLAQQHLTGHEHYVNSVSRDGVHQIVEIWRYHKRTVVGGGAIYDYEDLLPPDDPAAREIADYTLAVLDALEIRNGAGHTEVMLTADGPVLIECGARLGGGQMPDLLARCVGTNQVDRLAFAIVNPDDFVQESQLPYELRSRVRCVNLISLSDGTVPATEEAWAQVRALRSYVGLVLNLPAGSPAPRTVDLATCPGYLYLSSADAGQIEADYAQFRELERTGLYHPEDVSSGRAGASV